MKITDQTSKGDLLELRKNAVYLVNPELKSPIAG